VKVENSVPYTRSEQRSAILLREEAAEVKQGYNLELLEKRLGYCFRNPVLLKQAITHSSYTNEQKINKYGHYERLEFLGDAVLELVISEYLFHTHKEMPEGELTKMRASMVCEPSLAFCARDLELGEFLLLGKGEENTGGRKRDSITSDAMEAVIGAIYLDGGMEPAKAFIQTHILSRLSGDSTVLMHDWKTELQELIQKKPGRTVTYELIGESGPDHMKRFTAAVSLDNTPVGTGEGSTKKEAEQMAARAAMEALATI